jgi:hypothetical protein|tara:strand:+ start:89 stop:205 length:117 start_codon:yes stop_codon:yes gene_type:complete
MLINLLKKIIKGQSSRDLDAKFWIQKILLKKNLHFLKY